MFVCTTTEDNYMIQVTKLNCIASYQCCPRVLAPQHYTMTLSAIRSAQPTIFFCEPCPTFGTYFWQNNETKTITVNQRWCFTILRQIHMLNYTISSYKNYSLMMHYTSKTWTKSKLNLDQTYNENENSNKIQPRPFLLP